MWPWQEIPPIHPGEDRLLLPLLVMLPMAIFLPPKSKEVPATLTCWLGFTSASHGDPTEVVAAESFEA